MLHQDGRVVSNVSVNHMVFDVCGEKKHYIQLGTVMTDPEYGGRGLNRILMERVLSEYEGKTDGIYLFANDTVLDYYPKFGFRPAKEYEYYLPCAGKSQENSPYFMQKADATELSESLCPNLQNPNDGMYMSENMGLYWFRLAASFGDSMEEMVLGYTPASCDNFLSREYREEDTTLFILGEDLRRMEQEKRRFPALSHA